LRPEKSVRHIKWLSLWVQVYCQLHGLGKYPKEQRAEKYPMSDDSDRIDSFGELVNFDFLSELDLQQEDEIEKIFEFDCWFITSLCPCWKFSVFVWKTNRVVWIELASRDVNILQTHIDKSH